MAAKLVSVAVAVLLLSFCSCSILPGESEFTFPFLPRQDSCIGYYEGECDCSDPYVTVCDVAGAEWFPVLPSAPLPPPPENSPPPQNVPNDPGCNKKNAKDISNDFVVETGDIIDRKTLLYRIRQGKPNSYRKTRSIY